MKNRKNGGAWKGVIVGGITGAAAALLLAPQSGKRLRRKMARGVRDARDKTAELASDAAERTQELARAVGERATEWTDKAWGGLRRKK